jgi:hypothetical protein
MDNSWKWVVLKAEKEGGEDLQMDAGKTTGSGLCPMRICNSIGVKRPASISSASVTHSLHYVAEFKS